MDTGDTSWILTSTALVLFMTLPGLALFYGGLVNSKNVISVLMHCIVIACLASILWLVIAYSLAFSDGNPLIGGLSNIFLSDVGKDTLSGTIPETLFFMFQMTFAIITPALIIGAYVERIKFSAVLIFSALWLIIIYAPVTHWIWGGGWLAEQNIMDFAGGLVVHLTAGVSALVLAVILGRRKNFPDKISAPHNPSMVMIGASMLWVGWFGFNGFSQLAMGTFTDATAITKIAVNTHLAGAAGVVTGAIVTRTVGGKTDIIMMLNGALAGLVAITAEPLTPTPFQAIIIGSIGSVIMYYGTKFLESQRLDDVVGAIPVHMFAGIWGTLAVPITNVKTSFVTQLLGTISVCVFSFVLSYIAFKAMKETIGIRISKKAEKLGTDVSEIGVAAYAIRD